MAALLSKGKKILATSMILRLVLGTNMVLRLVLGTKIFLWSLTRL